MVSRVTDLQDKPAITAASPLPNTEFVTPDHKHSVNFLLNSNSSLPALPLPETTLVLQSTPLRSVPTSPIPDDVVSSSTRAESECTRFDELLTAANLLERSRTTTDATSTHHLSISPARVVLDPVAVRATEMLPKSELSSSSSRVSGDRVVKKRKKRPSVPCDICGRMFGEAAAVRKHKRVVHFKVKDFECEICSRKFAEKSNLKKHVQARHQQARSHKCSECGKVFNFTDGLRRHFNNCHLLLRPFHCDLCPSRFKQRTHLQKHKQSIHNVKSTPKRASEPILPLSVPHSTDAF